MCNIATMLKIWVTMQNVFKSNSHELRKCRITDIRKKNNRKVRKKVRSHQMEYLESSAIKHGFHIDYLILHITTVMRNIYVIKCQY